MSVDELITLSLNEGVCSDEKKGKFILNVGN